MPLYRLLQRRLSAERRSVARLNKLQGWAPVAGHQLEIISATRTRIRGRLAKGNIGVTFDSRKQGTSIFLETKTLRGVEIISIRDQGNDILTSLDGGQITIRTRKSDLLGLRSAKKNRLPPSGELVKRHKAAVEDVNRQNQAATKLRGASGSAQPGRIRRSCGPKTLSCRSMRFFHHSLGSWKARPDGVPISALTGDSYGGCPSSENCKIGSQE